MKAVNQAVTAMSQEQISALESEGSIKLLAEGQEVVVEREDVEILSEDMPGWSVANEGVLTVALDITLTDALRREGLAREVVKRIQTFRKESGFEITDRIEVVLQPNEALQAAVEEYKQYIASQVLAESISFAENDSEEVFEFEDIKSKFKINVINNL